MATQSDIRRHRKVIADLTLLAEGEVRDFLASLGIDDPRQIAAAVREFVPEVVSAFTSASSAMAADWYDELRSQAATTAAFSAFVLDPPDSDALQGAVGYALVPLFADTPAPETATDGIANLVATVVNAADRQTIEANTAVDRAGPRYARHASANACAFCRLLATRGAEYRSEESARRVVIGRGKRKVGERYHDKCRCTVVPTWNPAKYEEAPYVNDWRESYESAAEKVGRSDTKAILRLMRDSMSLQH